MGVMSVLQECEAHNKHKLVVTIANSFIFKEVVHRLRLIPI